MKFIKILINIHVEKSKLTHFVTPNQPRIHTFHDPTLTSKSDFQLYKSTL